MTEAVPSVLVCRCGAPMTGPAKNGQNWWCGKLHHYRVTSAGTTVGAIALRGDRASGVDIDRNYIWRPNPGSPEIRASPR